MRNILKQAVKSLPLLLLSLSFYSCDLNYENTDTMNPGNVWKDKTMIESFLTGIYGNSMPGWPINAGSDSDEGMVRAGGEMKDYLRGIIDAEKDGLDFSYGTIEKLNFFIDKLENIAAGVMSEQEREQMMGQAKFWRAWHYWNMVQNIGGVPLILKPQNPTNKPALFLPRNKTSECMNQIFKDLDEAISFLPNLWDDNNYGRIDKGTAMAYKGRIALWYASPLFNPSNELDRWETAYQVNKEAVNLLKINGKGLYPNYKELWYDEQNIEVVMVNQFFYPDHAYADNAIRPEKLTKDRADEDQPYLPLIMAYPMRDGSKLDLDPSRLSDATYNKEFMGKFYDRDDRFESTIFCGGTNYPTPDFEPDVNFWNVWVRSSDDPSILLSMARKQLNQPIVRANTGYNQLKALDKHNGIEKVYEAGKDWIEIRFAEVLMNYGECANELNKSQEALQVLYDIRSRAGVEAGSGQYGITATDQNQIREAYIVERQVEFAFEGKRFGDLRRWKRYDILNSHSTRATVAPLLKDATNIENFDWKSDIRDADIQEMFVMHYIPNVDKDDKYKFNLDVNHWFYPISKTTMDRNNKIQQNKEWGGEFDPLL